MQSSMISPDRLLELKLFDNGFHCDDRNGTVASSLRNVMHQALEAKAPSI
jgi:hypothetical protein